MASDADAVLASAFLDSTIALVSCEYLRVARQDLMESGGVGEAARRGQARARSHLRLRGGMTFSCGARRHDPPTSNRPE